MLFRSKGERKTSARKLFPGYILVKMDLNKRTWHMVMETPRVAGFVGASDDPASIRPVSEREVMKVTNQMAEGIACPALK